MSKKLVVKISDDVEVKFSMNVCQNILNRWRLEFNYLPNDEELMLHMEKEIDKEFKKHKIGSTVKKAISQNLMPGFRELILKEIESIKELLRR